MAKNSIQFNESIFLEFVAPSVAKIFTVVEDISPQPNEGMVVQPFENDAENEQVFGKEPWGTIQKPTKKFKGGYNYKFIRIIGCSKIEYLLSYSFRSDT